MNQLKQQLADLPTRIIHGQPHLSYLAVNNTVAAFLFPEQAPEQIDEAAYQRILETADTLCRQLGYQTVVKLTPPEVTLTDMGLYWSSAPSSSAAEPESDIIYIGPGRAEMMQEGLLMDARLSQLGLDEVTRQHFKIPVTASEGVIALMHRAVQSDWPNDYRGLWHDILGMCVVGGKDISPNERLFTVIIRGLEQRRYWQFKAQLQADNIGAPILSIGLADENQAETLFALGQVVMTPGAANLAVDFTPYLARHAAGDWGALDAFDKQQNDLAVKEGYRILSAYNIPLSNGETERIWIISEWDRSVTTILTPREY
jgi:hypothetical protein